MKLITQPEDGLVLILRSIAKATTCIDIVIFRFDLEPLERELEAAVKRGVAVRALVAHTNTGGEKRLRQLEARLLAAGVTVARTNDDLVRYHGKLLLIDRRKLFVLGFNFTSLDLESRSFGIQTKNPKVIRDVAGLIEADACRNEYETSAPELVVSPENARVRLMQFLRKTTDSLEIYDPNLSDDGMLALLKRLAARGVRIRILGKLEKKWRGDHFDARPFPGERLHVRAIVRDGRRVFVGSQSLRKLELDERREVGLIVRDPSIVKEIRRVFEKDWKHSRQESDQAAA
jgi:phosphatidylserine/phosphatidylglycerophosphate/cardiolipin synthase-like enzyme